ncbi:MAG: hypothetical protein ACREJ6_14325, partial [Candidatus Methylomirabilis sp.]
MTKEPDLLKKIREQELKMMTEASAAELAAIEGLNASVVERDYLTGQDIHKVFDGQTELNWADIKSIFDQTMRTFYQMRQRSLFVMLKVPTYLNRIEVFTPD